MSRQEKSGGRAGYGRARDQGEPGSHSGTESRARERVVPGVAAAREGCHRRDTRSGEPLKGVEANTEDEERGDARGEAGG
ncbi:hypothetical protein [Streptomyces sp. NPDC058664]|uniref:hypothetical protein n=1 Tax=unclassified Streptomyces TaxID=2593676 RepID=UPI003652EA66